MNKDRIQINGEWYVKENTVETLIDPKDITHTIECIWEDTNWCFIASLSAKEKTILLHHHHHHYSHKNHKDHHNSVQIPFQEKK
jgi:hypothetical protein